jgi:hypothetical protein
MAAICTSSVSANSCSHFVVTIDGVNVHLNTAELTALNADELQVLWKLAIRHKGVALAQLLNRVVLGDEGSNVKIYPFFGPGAAITKTNIGTTYVNICPGLNGEPLVADFTGCTEYRVRLYANLVGTGQFGARILRVGTSDVLHDAPNLGAAGERALDTGWIALPAAFVGQTILELVAQGKSQTAADDPIFRYMALGLR